MKRFVVTLVAVCGSVLWGCAPGSVGPLDEAPVMDPPVAPAPASDPDAGMGEPDALPAPVAEPDAGGDEPECSSTVDAPYGDLLSNTELTAPSDCAGCPGAFSGLEELDAPLAPDATTIRIEGASAGATRCEWYVLGGECGMTHGAMSTDPDGSGLFAATLPVFCGTNVVQIVCDNPSGSRVYVRQLSGAACEGRDLRVTLSWDERANDLELHLVREGGRINDPVSDCTWFTCVSSPLDWGVPGDASDDPSKDIDATGPFGPENIFLTSAAPGTYHVYVEYWGHGEPTTANLAVAIGESTVAELHASGLDVHDVWDVGVLSFPGGTFTPVDAIVPCQADWRTGGSRGCAMALP